MNNLIESIKMLIYNTKKDNNNSNTLDEFLLLNLLFFSKKGVIQL